jgi:hypothetical protein
MNETYPIRERFPDAALAVGHDVSMTHEATVSHVAGMSYEPATPARPSVVPEARHVRSAQTLLFSVGRSYWLACDVASHVFFAVRVLMRTMAKVSSPARADDRQSHAAAQRQDTAAETELDASVIRSTLRAALRRQPMSSVP